MDHPIPRPLGLAALITATVTLFSTGAMDQAGPAGKQNLIAQQPSSGIALSRQAFSPSVVTALQSNVTQPDQQPMRSRTNPLRGSQPFFRSQQSLNKKQLQGPNRHPELPKELPEDIRSARLMLSVESLLKSTTPN